MIVTIRAFRIGLVLTSQNCKAITMTISSNLSKKIKILLTKHSYQTFLIGHHLKNHQII